MEEEKSDELSPKESKVWDKKFIIIFVGIAIIVSSVNRFLTQNYTMDKNAIVIVAGVLGGAMGTMTLPIIFAYIIKGFSKLVKAPLTSKQFQVLLLATLCVAGGLLISDRISKAKRTVTADKKNISQTTAKKFIFQSEGCEYSVVFPEQPNISDSKILLFERDVNGKLGMMKKEGTKLFRAECYPLSPFVMNNITEKFAYKDMENIASAMGLTSDYQISCIDGELGKFCELKGNKDMLVGGRRKNVKINYQAYYGKSSVLFMTLIGLAEKFPSAEQILFTESVKLN